jgi:hypothetical protein
LKDYLIFYNKECIDNIPEFVSMLKEFSCDLDDLGKACKKMKRY